MTTKERCRCGMTDTPCQNPRGSGDRSGYRGRCNDCAADRHVSHKES